MLKLGYWADSFSIPSNGILNLPSTLNHTLAKKALVDAEMKLGKKHFPGSVLNVVKPMRAHAVLLATNYETVEVKVAPIECDLEQVVQRGDAAVAAHVQTPPNGRVNLEGQM